MPPLPPSNPPSTTTLPSQKKKNPHYFELFLVLVARTECQVWYLFHLGEAARPAAADSVTSLIHILSKPDVICMRMRPELCRRDTSQTGDHNSAVILGR